MHASLPTWMRAEHFDKRRAAGDAITWVGRNEAGENSRLSIAIKGDFDSELHGGGSESARSYTSAVTTSKKVASDASKELKTQTSKKEKEVAASALAQAARKGKPARRK